ncbi:hypothetical protein K1T71_009991 [Dendrolimus kikuchii]|uniref:Uncharacterized protein n=1 Tax=Dendrolimus kikuchii TaxID=765133 RepID=A0ACC1CTK2_9NEOP|nr:hypothetical protein K1T71_009991 [Dendrolimus kikuchii]
MLTNRMAEKYKVHTYVMQILLVCGVIIGSNKMDVDKLPVWGVHVARYIIYILLIRGSQSLCLLAMHTVNSKKMPDLLKLKQQWQNYVVMLVAAAAILFYSKQKIFHEDFLFLFIAYIVVKYPEMEKHTPNISYGTGMACSFFEGYLTHILPSDGANFVGFLENINIYESREGVVFPVRRLFIIITKTLKCPPDLKEFNKENRDDLPKMEACKSLSDVKKDVAGVKTRTYRNSAYKILRPGQKPVYVAAECATPLHTLHGVLQKRNTLYEELSNIDVEEVVEDFTKTLKSIISKSPECKDKCELVFYDNEDPTQNLADVLLDKISEIEPKFEHVTRNS